MNEDYRQVFYKQISKIDRVFDGNENSGADHGTPDGNLISLKSNDEHASLDEILFGM